MSETKNNFELSEFDHVNKIVQHVRPYIMADGGDLKLISIEDGIVTLQISGACAGCALISVTYDEGIKTWIMDEVPTIKDVVLLQDMSTDFMY